MHYHLGLICACCLNYFMTTADAMCWHTQLCRSILAGDNNDIQESPLDYEEDENGNGDYDFIFEED